MGISLMVLMVVVVEWVEWVDGIKNRLYSVVPDYMHWHWQRATACGTAAYSIPRIDQMETNQDEYVPEIQGYYAPNLTEILNQ